MHKILLVEDDVGMAEIVCGSLEDENFSVDHAVDGRAAKAYLETNVHDLILLDCKAFIELHGGTIRVDPVTRGQGSAFILTLPDCS